MRLIDGNLIMKVLESDEILKNNIDIISKRIKKKGELEHMNNVINASWQGINFN